MCLAFAYYFQISPNVIVADAADSDQVDTLHYTIASFRCSAYCTYFPNIFGCVDFSIDLHFCYGPVFIWFDLCYLRCFYRIYCFFSNQAIFFFTCVSRNIFFEVFTLSISLKNRQRAIQLQLRFLIVNFLYLRL